MWPQWVELLSALVLLLLAISRGGEEDMLLVGLGGVDHGSCGADMGGRTMDDGGPHMGGGCG